ncbi:hypothetical protein CVO77_10305 [Sphingopyxis lindanitolerans]|uniref:Protein-glutamine gamma-glutamyltransferase-like C-terminal domain-containing protein n=2 Tax=Sphingopyxis lindanitolerans TaxID=2054227 RepID=A0A2S8B916_9SPHN|nr:hypothetical protein CVO77_10305 [Sphingopyxis lindanitolerans]
MMSLWIAQASAATAAPAADASAGWLLDPELVGPGYSRTIAGGTIQTSFPPPPPPPPQSDPPWNLAWLRDFFDWTAPMLKPLMWIGAAVLLLLILYHFVPVFADWVDTLRFGRKHRAEAAEESVGEAEAGAARARLADADALAAAGRFAEAVHLLLYRSVDDIAGRRPGLVRPAMTSRELAAAADLPAVARRAFSRIARAVEISLFGGRSIDEQAWQECRGAYADLTVPKNWAQA